MKLKDWGEIVDSMVDTIKEAEEKYSKNEKKKGLVFRPSLANLIAFASKVGLFLLGNADTYSYRKFMVG